MQLVGFGGGCHWCTEAVFQSVKGVSAVKQGFIRSDPPCDSWSEGVEVAFDPEEVSLKSLISVHLATHASTSAHKMREKYRSAIYIFDDKRSSDAKNILFDLSEETGVQFVTSILPYREFKGSDERFQNYYKQEPQKPFCKTYIDPKLTKIRQKFPELMK